MTTDARIARATRLLRDTGAGDVEHPGGKLLDHLLRVQALLRDWSASDDVQLAGLCHACYGTDGFAPHLLGVAERHVLADAIGSSAEALVYLYGSCDRAQTYALLDRDDVRVTDRFTGAVVAPPAPAVRAFAEITAANEFDVVRHNPQIADRHGAALAALVERMSRHLSAGAVDEWRRTV